MAPMSGQVGINVILVLVCCALLALLSERAHISGSPIVQDHQSAQSIEQQNSLKSLIIKRQASPAATNAEIDDEFEDDSTKVEPSKVPTLVGSNGTQLAAAPAKQNSSMLDVPRLIKLTGLGFGSLWIG